VRSDPEHSRRPHLAIAGLTTLSVLVVLRPWNAADSVPRNLGDPVFVTWVLTWVSGTLASTPLDVFDAPIFWPRGDTLAYSDPLLGLAPVYGALHALTGSWTWSVGLLASGLVAATMVATFGLARFLTGRTDAALLAAVAMGLSDLVLAQWGHIQLQVMAAVPVGMWLLMLTLRRPSRAVTVGLGMIGGGLLVTTASVGLAWAVAATAMLAGHLVLAPSTVTRRVLTHLVAVGVLTAAIALPVAVPYLRLQGDPAFTRPLEPLASFEVGDLLRPTRERAVLGGLQLGPRRPADVLDPPTRERELHPGLIALLLAPVGLVVVIRGGRRPPGDEDAEAWWRVHGTRLVVAAGATAALVAAGPDLLGPLSPYRVLHEHVPGFSGLRVASRFALVTVLAVAVLAAAGWAAIAARMGRRPATVALAAILIAVSWIDLAIPVRWAELPTDGVTLAPYRALASGGARGPVVELPMAPVDERWDTTEAPRQLYATIDGRPRVNGFSGFVPPGYVETIELANRFPAPESVAHLRHLGVSTVVLHVDDLPAGVPASAARRVGDAWVIDLSGPRSTWPGGGGG